MAKHDIQIDEDGIDQAMSNFQTPVVIRGGRARPGPAPEPGLGSEPGPGSEPAWQETAEMIAGVIGSFVCPGWEIPEDKLQAWADSLAAVLDKHFPGGIEGMGNWGPWTAFAFASGALGLSGVDFNTMTLRPLKPVPPEEEEGQSIKPDQEQKPGTNNKGSFGIGGAE